MAKFYFSKKPNESGKGEIVTIGCDGARKMEADIDTCGANLLRFSRDGVDIVGTFVRPDGTNGGGSPVLYPLPNRVRDGVYHFNGKAYDQIKNGQRVLIHGLVRDEPFKYSDPVIAADAITFTVWVDFKPGEAVYEGFPFEHKFSMSFIISEDDLKVTYTVDNLSDGELPYGFGIHPFFFRHSGDDATTVSLPSDSVIECDENIMPTGNIIKVEGTNFDMRSHRPVKDLKFDTDFFNYPAGQSAEICYPSLGYKVVLETTDDYNHIMFFITPGNSWFCVENMTCSVNAHNLYAEGLKKESGLIILPAKTSKTGVITFAFEKI